MNWNAVQAIPWIIFTLVWVVSAAFTRRTVRREPPGTRLAYLLPLIVGSVLLFTSRLTGLLPGRVLPESEIGQAIGFVLAMAGVAFAIWARFRLGRLWSASVTLKEGHRLVQSGPYAITRHPIYTGILFALLGRAIANGTVRAFAAVPVVALGLAIKLSYEDRLMAESFGEEHAAYRQRVKKLVPYVW